MAGPSRTVRFFDADLETTVQKWLDEADSDVDDIRKDEDELVSEHDSRSEQSADSDCNENPEDYVVELCDRDYDVAEDECAGNNVAETDSEQFGLYHWVKKKITIHQILAPTMMQMISLYRNYWLDLIPKKKLLWKKKMFQMVQGPRSISESSACCT
ncbi:hypothetical protein JTB14_026671 [Gonioctena quinquepunctata]|nr:hypothetical protein JTB14_026671 [Gonioctena quinquepunctata]